MNEPPLPEKNDLIPTLDDKQGDFSYGKVQIAIEQLYDLRPKVLRIGACGLLLHRPDPDYETTPEERSDTLAVLEKETQRFNDLTLMLETGHACTDINPRLAAWLSAVAKNRPDDLALVQQVNSASQRVFMAAKSGSKDQSPAIREHRELSRERFHEAITQISHFMWHSYDKNQSVRLERVQSAADRLGKRLTRLERIGTHVRLVSLNASVEASHIGDAGRGLSLIAQEFKGLAEEVRTLAQEARADVDTMQVQR